MQSTYTFPFVHCISYTPSSAWDEMYEVFGDGHDYDWALQGDDEQTYDEELLKPEMKYQDVRICLHVRLTSILTSPRSLNPLKSVRAC